MNNQVLGKLFIGIILIVIVVVAVVQLANIFSSDDNGSAPSPDDITREFVDYDTAQNALIFTIDGPVEARETHDVIRMEITPSTRRLQLINGYRGNVVKQQRLNNDLAAYRTFLRGLEYEGFDESQTGTAETDDERGVCPLGSRYIVELQENDATVFRYWRATCSRNLGTFAGDVNAIRELFRDQFPDYRDFTRGLSIR